MERKPNHLIHEKSPYLLQHAYNPVDWHPWGEEAFEKARKEDKPVFVSIGYSTCHWCHVIEKESFDDEEVAKMMNEAFVCVLVDREERPDIDGIYMTVCLKMTGSGGWPLNIIMTPDKKPFFATTYIPKESRFGHVGMLEIIPKIKNIWKNNRGGVENLAAQVISSLKEVHEAAPVKELDEDVLNTAYEQLLNMFDEQHGGFGEAPKFPTPHNLMFLLRYWKRTGDAMAIRMVERTLSDMRMGGIYDHVGFGFHRYSVDAAWRVPHFEKMFYDQALLAIAYTEAFQATGNEEYGKTAKEIFTYVLQDMTSGGFYSGEDADSEGEEGKFYFWTEEEISSLLSDEEAFLVKKVFNIEKEGNFVDEASGEKTGKNILYLNKSISEIASLLRLSVDELQKRLEEARQKLYDAREKRVHPAKDDKILADWNGLMIAALAKGAQVFDSGYAEAARKAADFVLSKMYEKGRLYHRYREGEIAVPGFLDDYALFIWGLIELYENTFEVNYLRAALDLTNYSLVHFWDGENGGFYFTEDGAENILVRRKEIYDGALPSGNSVAMLNLLRLGRITANPDFEKKASQIGRAFTRDILQTPVAHSMVMAALEFALNTFEVVIAGDLQAEDTKAMLSALRSEFIPGKVVVFRPETGETGIAGYTKDLVSKEGRATAYVCRNYSCKLPTTDAGEMLELLKAQM